MWKRLASSAVQPLCWPFRSAARLAVLLALCGLALLCTGLWWIYPPAALLTPGALLLVEAERLSRKLAQLPAPKPAPQIEARA